MCNPDNEVYYDRNYDYLKKTKEKLKKYDQNAFFDLDNFYFDFS